MHRYLIYNNQQFLKIGSTKCEIFVFRLKLKKKTYIQNKASHENCLKLNYFHLPFRKIPLIVRFWLINYMFSSNSTMAEQV